MKRNDLHWPILLNFFFILFSLLIIFPFWTVFIDSIDDSLRTGFRLLPAKPTIEPYKVVFEQNSTLAAFYNSVFRTVVGTLLATICIFCGAYALSKKRMPFNRAMTAFVIIPMFFGGGLIPTFLLMVDLQLLDSRWALIWPAIFNGFFLLVTRNFIYSIPAELEESALLDGANELKIAFRIFLPLSLPIIATVALWSAVGHWNAWFDAMIYIRSPSKQVLQVLLRRILNAAQNVNEMMNDPASAPPVTPRSIQSALLFVTTLPILVVYPFAQKYFIRGLTAGAVKG